MKNFLKFILTTFLKIVSFCFGFGALCFALLFLYLGIAELLFTLPFLISILVSISFYLMAKVMEDFFSMRSLKNSYASIIVKLAKNSPKKISVLLISLTCLLVIQYLNFTGFCYKEGRYLTEQELVDRVIEKEFVISDDVEREKRLNKMCINYGKEDENYTKEFPQRKCGMITYKSIKEFVDKADHGGDREECYADRDELFKKSQLEKCRDNKLYYSSVQEFHKKNPDCCYLHEPNWFEDIMNDFFNYHVYYAEILHKTYPFKKEPYYHHFYSFDSCGRSWSTDGSPEESLAEEEFIEEIKEVKKEMIKQRIISYKKQHKSLN